MNGVIIFRGFSLFSPPPLYVQTVRKKLYQEFQRTKMSGGATRNMVKTLSGCGQLLKLMIIDDDW